MPHPVYYPLAILEWLWLCIRLYADGPRSSPQATWDALACAALGAGRTIFPALVYCRRQAWRVLKLRFLAAFGESQERNIT
jgi:hypothetical protein